MSDNEKYVIRWASSPNYATSDNPRSRFDVAWSRNPAKAMRFERHEAVAWIDARMGPDAPPAHKYYVLLTEAELVAAILAGPP